MTDGERILQPRACRNTENNYIHDGPQKRHLVYFLNNSVKNQPIFMIISIHISEDISNYTVVMFPVKFE